MKTTETQGQGQVNLSTRTADENALAYARALMESSPRLDEGESEGTEGGGSESTVQSEPAPSVEGGEGEGSTGFIEPYLEGVPEEVKGTVSEVLEKYRSEQDAKVNQRFEKLQEETRVPTTVYQSLITDPIGTLDWIADRFQEEQGLDIRSQLKERWFQSQEQQVQSDTGQGQPKDSDQPLTQKQLDEILERKEQERQQAAAREAQQRQIQEQQNKTVQTWTDNAAKKFGLPLEDSEGQEDPLRAVIIMQANELHTQGVAKGEAAIEMAVEQIAKRFRNQKQGSGDNGQQPKVAEGGSPPPPKDFDVSNEKARRERMLEMFGG